MNRTLILKFPKTPSRRLKTKGQTCLSNYTILKD